ncbi:MAG: tetratricopeptide repeat protein [Myxococcales bacterium]|nr:tetratricopeptide repeat protein [Myxococcales bacterium]
MRAVAARLAAATAAEFEVSMSPSATDLTGLAGRDVELARSYLALAAGNLISASKITRDAVATYPQDAEAQYLAGRVALERGDLAGALAALGTSVRLGPTPLAYVALARARAGQGDDIGAVAELDRALQLVPGHPEATMARARVSGAPSSVAATAELAASLERLVAARTDGALAEVSPGQQTWARVALADLRLASGDLMGARAVLAAAPAQITSPRLDAALVEALVATGEVKAARRRVDAALAATPTRGELRVAAARVAVAEGRPGDALELLASADELGRTPSAQVTRASAFSSRGEPEAAARALDEGLVTAPGDRRLLLARAEIDLSRGRPREAASRFDELYRKGQEPSIGVLFGAALRRSGEDARAREVLERVAACACASATTAALELGRLHRATGAIDAATRAFEQAGASPALAGVARAEIAGMLLDTGKVRAAREAIDALVAGEAPDVEAWLECARIRVAMGALVDAGRCLDRASQPGRANSNDTTARLARERGRHAFAQRHNAEAARELARAAALAPGDLATRLLQLEVTLAQGNTGGGAVLGEIQRRFPGDAGVDIALGRVRLAQGKSDEAARRFDAASAVLEERRAPARVRSQVRFLLGRARYEASDLRAADAAFEEALGLDPANADAHYYVGLVALYEREDTRAAQSAFERAVEANASHADAWFYLGEAASSLGLRARSREAFERYLELAPSGELAADARRKLRR